MSKTPRSKIAVPIVLLLTGTCGVGKTTTCRAWATARRGAHVSGDEIRLWIRDKTIRHANNYQQEATASIAATAVEAFVALGLDVALDFVWTPTTLRSLSRRFAPIADVKMAWLRCERTENRRRDAERPANVVMGDRVDELLAELDALSGWPDEMLKIDTTHLSVEEVLNRLA